MAAPVLILAATRFYTLLIPRHLSEVVRPYPLVFVAVLAPLLLVLASWFLRKQPNLLLFQVAGIAAGHFASTVATVSLYAMAGQLSALVKSIQHFGLRAALLPLLFVPALFGGFAAGWLAVGAGLTAASVRPRAFRLAA